MPGDPQPCIPSLHLGDGAAQPGSGLLGPEKAHPPLGRTAPDRARLAPSLAEPSLEWRDHGREPG